MPLTDFRSATEWEFTHSGSTATWTHKNGAQCRCVIGILGHEYRTDDRDGKYVTHQTLAEAKAFAYVQACLMETANV